MHVEVRVVGRSGWLGILVLGGCGDSLVGRWELESRIGSPELPARAAWEVRWVRSDGLEVDCRRVDAEVPQGAVSLLGAVELPAPSLPDPSELLPGDGFAWRLGLPVLVWHDAPFPEVGSAELDPEQGHWGTSAPLGWLVVEGPAEAAGDALSFDGAPLRTGWVDVIAEIAADTGSLAGALGSAAPDAPDEGLWAVATDWSEDAELELWSGWTVGGVSSTCGDP